MPEGEGEELVEVLLEAPGEGAPAPLRLRPRPGQVQVVRMEMDARVGVEIGGASRPPMAVPTIAMELETRVTDVATDGTFRQEARVRSVEGRGGRVKGNKRTKVSHRPRTVTEGEVNKKQFQRPEAKVRIVFDSICHEKFVSAPLRINA